VSRRVSWLGTRIELGQARVIFQPETYMRPGSGRNFKRDRAGNNFLRQGMFHSNRQAFTFWKAFCISLYPQRGSQHSTRALVQSLRQYGIIICKEPFQSRTKPHYHTIGDFVSKETHLTGAPQNDKQKKLISVDRCTTERRTRRFQWTGNHRMVTDK
jgi:hypothetical protein